MIMCLRAADIFFSVGSGFFCAAMALEEQYQPVKIVCLWEDSLYRYKDKINAAKWHKDIMWVDDINQLEAILS